MPTRRDLLAALAALPVVGRFARSEPPPPPDLAAGVAAVRVTSRPFPLPPGGYDHRAFYAALAPHFGRVNARPVAACGAAWPAGKLLLDEASVELTPDRAAFVLGLTYRVAPGPTWNHLQDVAGRWHPATPSLYAATDATALLHTPA